MNKDKVRQIHTGLYSKVAKEIIDSVIGQLSDGWGENNPANAKWWQFVECKQASDNEVLIEVSTEPYEHGYYDCSYNGFYRMSESEVKEKFAGWIKKTAKMEIKDTNDTTGWKRNSEMKLTYLSYQENITIADAYLTYETLLGRGNCNKYTYSTVAKVVGEKLSEEATKVNEEKMRQIREKIAHRDMLLKQLEDKEKDSIKQIEAQYAKDRFEIVKQCKQWIDDINAA